MPEGHAGSIDGLEAASPVWGVAEAPLAGALQHFYRTSALPCPYLGGHTERKLVTELVGRDALRLYNDLSRAGFRRSHHLAYRPGCAGCQACVPVRIAALRFRESRSSRRVRSRNADVAGRDVGCRASLEQYRLFLRYQRTRHGDSDMAAMSYADYRAMVEYTPVDTRVIEFRNDAAMLIGACLVDKLDDGYSAVYSFYDPDLAERSLGSRMIFWLVETARAQDLPYVYLGYWISASEKMAYKSRFHPLECLGEQGWQPFSP
jgi:arginine-tRNA-protein transferase